MFSKKINYFIFLLDYAFFYLYIFNFAINKNNIKHLIIHLLESFRFKFGENRMPENTSSTKPNENRSLSFRDRKPLGNLI